MIKQEIGEIDGKKVSFCQCESITEAEQNGFPKGVYFCWERAGERIFNAYEILVMVQNSIQKGNYLPRKMIDKESIKAFHNRLYRAQKQQIVNSLESLKEEYKKYPAAEMAGTIKAMDALIESHKDSIPFPNETGWAKLTRKQARDLAGGKDNLDKFYSEDIQQRLFGD